MGTPAQGMEMLRPPGTGRNLQSAGPAEVHSPSAALSAVAQIHIVIKDIP